MGDDNPEEPGEAAGGTEGDDAEAYAGRCVAICPKCSGRCTLGAKHGDDGFQHDCNAFHHNW